MLEKLKTQKTLKKHEQEDLKNLPIIYLICHFNGFDLALNQLEASKPLLAKHSENMYNLYKETMRILRKVKYN